MISDVRSAIPVENIRTGMRGIVAGTGNLDKLSLANTSITTDVRVGDSLISSGLDGRFPAGYPVGVVSTVKHISGEQFAVITVKPSANLNRSGQVLLVWPHTATKQPKS
jgi:rod shape-determining protein MreC